MTIDTDKLTELLQACTPLPLSVVDNGLERFDILNANGGVVATWLTEDVAIAIVAVMNAAPELIAQFEAMLADHTASHDLRARVNELEKICAGLPIAEHEENAELRARVKELEADNARLRKQDKGSTHR